MRFRGILLDGTDNHFFSLTPSIRAGCVSLPNPDIRLPLARFSTQIAELISCSLEHDDSSLVCSSGASDATNVTLFASSRPAPMHKRTIYQTENALEAFDLVPYA